MTEHQDGPSPTRYAWAEEIIPVLWALAMVISALASLVSAVRSG